MYGYRGRALLIDLSSQTVSSDPLDAALLRQYIGGVGLAARLLYTYSQKGVHPFSPQAAIVIAGGPFAGVGLVSSSKFAVACKSPLTSFIGDSLSSGSLGRELKRMPFDALVITGKSDGPTYLLIQDDTAQFRSAQHLVGRSATEAERIVRAELGNPSVRLAAIGPAGEHLVRYACITSEGRQAGRTGAGAVMGSKNLKAIAFRGASPCYTAHPEELAVVASRLNEASEGRATAKYRGPGTIANLARLNELAALPSYNFRASSFEGAGRLSPERLQRGRRAASGNGTDSSRDWEHLFRTTGGAGARVKSRVEYESLFALGPLCGIDDPDTIIRACALCDRLGIDTISAGGTIAWAMESFERGLINRADTQGLELTFGSREALLTTIEKIGRREGLGDLLAEGSRAASSVVGGGSEAWAMQVKGLEMPGYDPRAFKTLALGLAVNARGACHNRSSSYDIDSAPQAPALVTGAGPGELVAAGEDFAAVLDSLILSRFLRHCFVDFYSEVAQLYELITGWETSGDDLRQVGERINALRRAYNIREGWSRADDTLPPRIFESGALYQDDLNAMIDDYYGARGWTPGGLIPEEKMRSLGLMDAGSRQPGLQAHPVRQARPE